MTEYHPKLYEIDELILDIYNAVYLKSDQYQVRIIDVSDLVLDRFKSTDYNLDTIFEKTKILYSGKSPTGLLENISDPDSHTDQIIFKRKGETHASNIRIIPYSNINVVNNMLDPINVNQIIGTLLSELVVSDRTNNILLPVINIDVNGSDLIKYDKLHDLIDSKKIYSVEITEKFYSLITLDSFLMDYPTNLPILKTIIYQVIDVLYLLNNIYSNFRHRQMIPSMINAYIKKIDNVIVPEIKLGNFFMSSIGDMIPNNYPKNIDIPTISNSYDDLYQFLNYMWNNYNSIIIKYSELIKLFDTILPKEIRSSDMYLTKELWNKLSDDHKDNLKIKNIRNNNFFSNENIILSKEYINPVEEYGIKNKNMKHTTNSNQVKSNIKMKNKIQLGSASDNDDGSDDGTDDNSDDGTDDNSDDGTDDNSDDNSDDESDDGTNDNSDDDIAQLIDETDESDIVTQKDIDELILDIGESDSDIDETDNGLDDTTDTNIENGANLKSKIKSFDNDIDNMSRNNIQKNKSNKDKKESRTYFEEEERTEERDDQRPSRIINVSEKSTRENKSSDKSISKQSDQRQKMYQGKRHIKQPVIEQYKNTKSSNNSAPINNLYSNNTNYPQSRNTGNAIGNLLGASPSDYTQNKQNMPYQSGNQSGNQSVSQLMNPNQHGNQMMNINQMMSANQMGNPNLDSTNQYTQPYLPGQIPMGKGIPPQQQIDQMDNNMAMQQYLAAYNNQDQSADISNQMGYNAPMSTPQDSQQMYDPQMMQQYMMQQRMMQQQQNKGQSGGSNNPFFFR